MEIEYVIVYASPLFLAAIVALICFLFEKFYPSSIEKSHKGKLGDSYSVSVCLVGGKGTAQYIEHVFTKRKNGKYILRFGFFEWLMALTVALPTCGLYGFIIYVILLDTLKSNPLEAISYIIVVGLILLEFIALMGNSIIRAIILFKRFQKGFQN